METIIAEITGDELQDLEILRKAASILKSGGLVAFPTETVYGLGADALDTDASAKVYSAKGRPSDNPLIVHIANINDLEKLTVGNREKALKLAERFWPGPLTIILQKSNCVPESITGGLKTVAVRMPSHPVARKLIQISGVYIAAPSANLSGKPSPTMASHVIDDMNGRIDMIIKDDTVDIGIESTIIDLSEEIPSILRPGFITREMLQEVIGIVGMDFAITSGGNLETVAPKAPGMKYRHYAPDGQLTIVEGDDKKVIASINNLAKGKIEEGYKVGIMTTDEHASSYEWGTIKCLGSKADEASVARHLYSVLREFNELKIDFIYSEGFSNNDVGQAVMNRLIKAAGHKVIKA